MTIPWLPLGARQPRSLRDARLILHHAAWVLGSAAHSLVHHEADDSHTSLGFDPRGGTLFTHRLGPEKHAPELHLVIESLKLELRRGGDEVIAYRQLSGQTMDEAFAWIEKHARDGWSPDARVVRRDYADFPEHPIGAGRPFDPPDTAAHAELARWYADGAVAIRELRKPWASLTEPRIWPHHFDLAATIPLSSDESGDDRDERTVDVGLSPGDLFYEEPYFYCSPDPQPDAVDLPHLPAGHWHRHEFVAAILSAEELFYASEGQEHTVSAWLRAAVDACARLLGETRS